jgi:hypothetical protein
VVIKYTTILGVINYIDEGETMGVFDTIKDRRSIRSYKGESIPKEKIDKLMEETFYYFLVFRISSELYATIKF